jgi:predicted restriction endonuclease
VWLTQTTCEKLIREKREMEAAAHSHSVRANSSEAHISSLTEKVALLTASLGNIHVVYIHRCKLCWTDEAKKFEVAATKLTEEKRKNKELVSYFLV